MKRNRSLRHVILAVDLAAEDTKLLLRIWNALRPLLRGKNTVVEPVTVLNRQDVVIANYGRKTGDSLKGRTEKQLTKKIKGLGLKHLASPKVLFADGASTHQEVKALLNYAKKTRTDLIALSSHSRRGVPRFFLGSFAESLSLAAEVPLFVVNPHQRTAAKSCPTVVFPTDFSEASKRGLDALCKTFEEEKLKVVLLHSFTFPVQFSMEPFISFPIPQSAIDEEIDVREKIGKRWCSEIEKRGFESKLVIDRKSFAALDAVMKIIRSEKASLVAMTSLSGKVTTALLGSLTRQVLRNSPCPVWVIHPSRR